MCFFTVLGSVNASNFTVAIVPVSKQFKVSTTEAGYLICFNVCLMGVGNLFWVALMRVVGKRPVYLVALLFFVATNVWSYYAETYGSLLASRLVSGFVSSAADATGPSLVADLFFIHERGHYMMMFQIALSAGFFLGPLVCAYITQDLSWRWSCGLLAVCGGATLLFGTVFIRESNYPREEADVNLPASSYPPKRSFVSWMSVTRGYNKNESFFKIVGRTLALIAYPPILWTGLTIGTFVGWCVVFCVWLFFDPFFSVLADCLTGTL